jgi:hypothetical protein
VLETNASPIPDISSFVFPAELTAVLSIEERELKSILKDAPAT